MEKMTSQSKKVPLFNTPFEIGARILILLDVLEKPFTLDELVKLDYIFVHSSDFNARIKSVHAEIPYRKGELIIKREAVQQAINLFFAKGLIDKDVSKEGIRFKSNDLSTAFLSHFDSRFYKKLKAVAKWIAEDVPTNDISSIDTFVSTHVGDWKTDFGRTDA